MAPLLRYIECRLNNWFSKINGVMTSSSYKSRRKIGGGGHGRVYVCVHKCCYLCLAQMSWFFYVAFNT